LIAVYKARSKECFELKFYFKLIVIKAAADKLEKADDYNVAYDHLKEKKAA
jgi:hypothetical protein